MEILNKYYNEIAQSRKRNKSTQELGFNFFSSISESYYRENFHSDILKTILSIPEFFEVFFEELSKKEGQQINFEFSNTIIDREKNGRIDISVIDCNLNKAIIIENKINDAVDMKRQLPRYYDNLFNKGYKIVNIVYLSISGNKHPPKSDWTVADKINLENKITIMSAVDRENVFNLDQILSKAILKTNNIDHIVFLKQYKSLINFLGSQEINHYIMDELYSKVQTQEDLENLLTLKRLIDELPKY